MLVFSISSTPVSFAVLNGHMLMEQDSHVDPPLFLYLVLRWFLEAYSVVINPPLLNCKRLHDDSSGHVTLPSIIGLISLHFSTILYNSLSVKTGI